MGKYKHGIYPLHYYTFSDYKRGDAKNGKVISMLKMHW